MVDGDGNVKLSDFGLSVKLESDGETRSSKCGNFRTIAPEILND